MEELVSIGKITGTHHLKGALKINLNIDDETALVDEKVLVEKPNGEKLIFTVTKVSKLVGDKFLVEFKEIENKTEANLLHNSVVKVNRNVLGLAEGEFLLQDLLNMEVFTEDKFLVGKVSEVFDTTAHEILVVDSPTHETMIPNIKPFIINVDFEKRIIIVDLWDGMMEEKKLPQE